MTDLLFDTPWWLLAGLAILGTALWFSGNARLDRRLKTTGLSALGLAVVLGLISYFVQTDREKVEAGTRRLIQAVVKRDGPGIAAELDPKVTFANLGREQIEQTAVMYAERFGLSSASVTSMETREQPGAMLVTLRVFTQHTGGSSTMPAITSDWQLTWMPASPTPASKSGWAVRKIAALQIGQMDGGEIVRQYLSGRLKP